MVPLNLQVRRRKTTVKPLIACLNITRASFYDNFSLPSPLINFYPRENNDQEHTRSYITRKRNLHISNLPTHQNYPKPPQT